MHRSIGLRRAIPVACSIVLITAFGSGRSGARGATLLVPQDHATIGGAALAATAGDTILVAAGTYPEHGIVLGSGVVLMGGTGDPTDVVIDCAGQGVGLSLTGTDSTTTVADLTIRAGIPGLRCDQADGRIRNCRIFGFDYKVSGIVISGSSPRFYRCEIRRQHNTQPGAALDISGARPVFRECSFPRNRYDVYGEPVVATVGGIVRIADGSAAEFYACRFDSNFTAGRGAIGILGSTVLLDSCTVAGTTGESDFGGAVHVADDGALTVGGCLFTANTAGAGDGGRIGVWGGQGGAIYAAGDLQVHGSVFAGNTAPGSAMNQAVYPGRGGAIRAVTPGRPALLSHCVFYANSAHLGSAVNGYAALDHSILACSAYGAPVANDQTTVVCCDIWGNDGGDWVGGIADRLGVDGNFTGDPRFCAAETGDFRVCADSPCLPGNLPGGCDAIIGAFGAGCPACPGAAVSGFRATFVAAGVAMTWRLTVDLPAAELRLLASGGGPERIIVPERLAAGQYAAVDAGCAGQGGATVMYSLERRILASTWAVLAVETFVVPVHAAPTSLGPVAPNPFNPRTVVNFTLTRAGRATITVHDLAGRLVAVLADREWSAGPHAVPWQGRDRAGRGAAAGSYVVRLAAGGVVDTRRVTLVR
ncbi:MAG: hypothetical protein IH621_04940 [Krumholzibacteria bacterium]|nr:hypothetical protein [Candidatus Krumholzibacteria bacterium]